MKRPAQILSAATMVNKFFMKELAMMDSRDHNSFENQSAS
jgi:hypothetical protein